MNYSHHTICIVGGTGSLGNELVQRFYKDNIIHVISRDELKQWNMKIKFPNVNFYIGDIRCCKRINELIDKIQPTIIINASAMKHIDICENNVSECLSTNVDGVTNITNACSLIKHKHVFVQVSTDKSVSPTTLYGASKMIAERIVIDYSKKNTNGVFLVVRYGNVLNSRGSIIPKYLEISKNDLEKSFPITDYKMTRFFMTLQQSVLLIISAIEFGKTGEIWIPKVPAFKIYDLTKLFSDIYKKDVRKIDIRAGEKMHEILINEVEIPFVCTYTDWKGNLYYVIKQNRDKDDVIEQPKRNIYIYSGLYKCVNNIACIDNILNEVYSSELTSDSNELKELLDTFIN